MRNLKFKDVKIGNQFKYYRRRLWRENGEYGYQTDEHLVEITRIEKSDGGEYGFCKINYLDTVSHNASPSALGGKARGAISFIIFDCEGELKENYHGRFLIEEK